MKLSKIIKADSKELQFDCGCSVPIVDGTPLIDYDLINLQCPVVYELLEEGHTSDIFQLNSHITTHYSKEIKPQDINDIALLISVVRPGTLNVKLENGHSAATTIVRRRNNEEPTEYVHKLVEEILKPTNGIQVYQEQIMEIARVVAGFTHAEAYKLCKGIAKKKADIISGLKTKFLEGCKTQGLVTDEEAIDIFATSEAAARYSFNKCLPFYGEIGILGEDGKVKYEIIDTLYRKYFEKKNEDRPTFKTYSLRFWERSLVNLWDNITKNSEMVENEIEDITPAGDQLVYRITMRRKKIVDKNYALYNRPHFSIEATAFHKFPTRCHGDVMVKDLKEGIHSLYCYDPMQAYRPKYRHAASRIIKIEKVGVVKTYDVTMKAPYHNFLCNDVFTCNSHAVGYGMTTYETAWAKAHFPLEDYTACLRVNEERGGRKEKALEEKAGLIKEAAEFGITIKPPSILFPVVDFSIYDNSTIYFGLSNVKSVGVEEAEVAIEKYRECKRWLDVLFKVGENIKSLAFNNLCRIGTFDKVEGVPNRARMCYEYETYCQLTKKEISWIFKNLDNFESFESCISGLIENAIAGNKDKGISRKDRIPMVQDYLKTLREPPHPLDDTPILINKWEKDLIGVAITYSDIEARSLTGIYVDTTCKEFNDGKNGKNMRFAVSLKSVKEHKAKNGKNMAFLSCQDDSDVINSVVVFPDVYEEIANLLQANNTVVISGDRSKDGKSLVVNKVMQI